MILTIDGKNKIFDGKFLKVWSTAFKDTTGKSHEWEWIEGHNFVAILPILDRSHILLIRLFRVPVEKYVLDVPTGVIDPTDEDPHVAALRELKEETGYRADKLISLPPVPHSPGNSTSMMFPFIATNLEKIFDSKRDAEEDIEVVSVPVNSVISTYMTSANQLFNIRILGLMHIAIEKGLCDAKIKKGTSQTSLRRP